MNKFKIGDKITPGNIDQAYFGPHIQKGMPYRVLRVDKGNLYFISTVTGARAWIDASDWSLVSSPSKVEQLVLTEEDYYNG